MLSRLLALAGVFALSVVFIFAAAARDAYAPVAAPVVLKNSTPRVVYSENGLPNGMPCEWYAYAPLVGVPACGHPGIDIDANYETLYAATDGIVEFAGPDAAYWPMHVDIRSTEKSYEGYLMIYGHMSEIWVAPGQAVKKGEAIGVSGTAGSGPHLHFELRSPPDENCPIGCSVDPVELLERPLKPSKGTPAASPVASPAT